MEKFSGNKKNMGLCIHLVRLTTDKPDKPPLSTTRHEFESSIKNIVVQIVVSSLETILGVDESPGGMKKKKNHCCRTSYIIFAFLLEEGLNTKQWFPYPFDTLEPYLQCSKFYSAVIYAHFVISTCQ